MAYDSITTAAVAAELRGRLTGGRVDKIVQPSTFAVALLIRAGGANHWLVLSAHPQHARVALSAERMAKAFDEPSPFVMLLRKHLDGARLATVEQVGRDRVLRLAFRAHAASATLIAEVMGRHSNVILVDDKDIILGAVKRITPTLSRQRVVLPHHPYTPPPVQTQPPPLASEPKLDPLTATPEALAAALAARPDDAPLAQALVDVLAGVSPQLAREVAYRLAGATDVPLGAQRARAGAALDVLRALLAPDRRQPSLVRHGGKIVDWAAYPLLQHGVEPERYDSISAVLDEVYSGLESGDALGAPRAGLRAAIMQHRTRLARKAESLRAGLRSREELDALRVQGEMVLAFAHAIVPGQRELRLDDPPLVVPLDPTRTPAENAQAIFQRYRKARDAATRVPPLLAEVEVDVQFLDAALLFVEQADSAQALKEVKDDLVAAGFRLPGEKARPAQPAPKGKGGKYHPGGKEASRKSAAAPALRFTTRDGLEVLVGRSARQNEVVTFELAASGDLWFHARGLPGSHVVLKTAGRTPPATSVEQAAELAAYYSRGGDSTSVPVDVVPARHVHRVKGGKPGLVRISGETTINVRPRAEATRASS
jgi:predicted ribosome quality control (RQC) complex YloA/Tae2 family protein